MRRAWQFAALFALEALATAAVAAPRTPCEPAEAPAVMALADRLARSDDPSAWQGLMPAAAAAALDSETFSTTDRACAAYVAGSAAFFLSADRSGRVPSAAAAVRHFALAEALAPAAMGRRQPRSRMTTAWQRLGPAPGWLRGRKPLPFALPLGPAGRVRIGPADGAAWAAVCPAAGCEAPIEVPRGEDGASVSLRPGWYRVEHVGPCGITGHEVELTGGLLPIPEPAVCTAQISARDGEQAVEGVALSVDGEPIDGAQAPVAVPIRVEAPGYVAQLVSAPAAGGPLAVALVRCPVNLEVLTRPTAAKVEGAGSAPWGARTIRVSAPGHGPVERTVEVALPEGGCGGSQQETVELPRPVSVVATNHQGDPVSVARLLVQGEQVDPVGLYRPSGRYGVQAMHPTLGAVTTKFEVGPCDGPDCGPVRVEVRFPPPPAVGRSLGATLGYVAGGSLVGLGALAGVSAWSLHGDVQNYESKAVNGVPLQSLVDRRDGAARVADLFVLTGGLTLLITWWLDDAGEGQ